MKICSYLAATMPILLLKPVSKYRNLCPLIIKVAGKYGKIVNTTPDIVIEMGLDSVARILVLELWNAIYQNKY